jgi:hypothetical protein
VPSISRPSRIFSFADWSRTRPKEPPPGDRLDAQIANLIDAIHSTQLALADIRRDDGKLINASVALEQLAPAVEQHFTKDVRSSTLANAVRAEGGAAVTAASEQSAQLFAQDAEAAAISAARFLSAANTAQKIVEAHTGRVETLSDTVEAETIEAQDWANYSHAQADNAIAAKDEALQWAEYLAGPVVDSEDAPAYIADSAFPHGLYYQPVEGYGGVAGLWSAKWWAVYAAQLVGACAADAWQRQPGDRRQGAEPARGRLVLLRHHHRPALCLGRVGVDHAVWSRARLPEPVRLSGDRRPDHVLRSRL